MNFEDAAYFLAGAVAAGLLSALALHIQGRTILGQLGKIKISFDPDVKQPPAGGKDGKGGPAGG